MKRIKLQDLPSILKKLCTLCVAVFHILLYLILVSEYVGRKIFLSRNSFFLITILYWSLTFLLYYGKRIKLLQKCFILHGKPLMYAVFAVVPLGAFFIEEIAYNPYPFSISLSKILMNYIFFIGIEAVLLFIFFQRRPALIITLFLAWVYGVANYYVMEFKGNPLLPSDLLAYKTAATVAGNYTFNLTDSIVYAALLLMFFACLISMVPDREIKRDFRNMAAKFASGIALGGILVTAIYNINWSAIYDITLDGWEPQNSYYENGALFTFLMEVQELSISAPTGYISSDARDFLAQEDLQIEAPDNNAPNIRPSVIVVMNESFSDLAVLGEFEADDCLENWNRINDFVLRGYTYASVVGGGTCNSEFEFLTGNSMANLSGNSYPYQMYNFDKVSNLASEFSRNGYNTIAIHPENRNNWNRAKVYSQFGFNRFLSLDDIGQREYIRYYLSDKSDYMQVISSYENSEKPVFIFNVTMQNHGGYNEDTMPGDMKLVNIEKKYRQYKDVITYMTLVKESDQAFIELLDYFSKVEEPVIICMFGDHQPAVSEEFVAELQGTEEVTLESIQARCCVPYIIWSNYDTGIKNITLNTSLNYLGMDILGLAGLHTPYSQFLTKMQKEIPIINKYGYQTADGIWKTLEEPNELLEQYRKLQYYMLFDRP